MLIAVASVLVLASSLSSSAPDRNPVSASATLTSWNPNVTCSPSLVTVADILGSAYPAQALAGSQYQVNSTDGGIPDKRALSPPCTITNVHNQVVSTFVQVDGVYLYTYTFNSGDCSKGFKAVNGGGRYPNNQTFCDNTGDIRAIGTTNGYIHVEFDQDWLAKGYCGSTVSYCNNVTIANEVSTGSISLDLQGFVYWDENHWELHPLAAWRLTNPPPPPPPADFSIGASPSSLTVSISASGTSTITLTSLNGLAGTGSLSASISSSDLVLVWPTVGVSPSSVTLTANGTATSTLTISTSLLTTPATYTVTITATVGSITHDTTVTVVVTVV
jgi:hypothetical protein